MDCLIKTVKQEEEILSKNDNEIRQILIDIAANLSAVGVPMTAIYFSGSVIGISAVGITSGLAALGLGGMLIFSPMLAGIGVAVLLGVSAHNLVKKISDEGNNRYCRTKELMLQEVIKNLQMTMNYLIEDLNEISRQLSNEIKKGIMVKSEIEELANMISILTKSAESVGEKIENTQKENLISQLPEIIDESKVVKLTSEIELKKYHEYIMECYQVVEEKSCEDKKYYKLNDQLSENRLYKLKDAIEAIGYNDPLITHMLI
jgi:DNA-binding transcriptional MerR regulator